MPIEAILFQSRSQPLKSCPKCGAEPFECFLRGQVASWWRSLLGKPSWAVICRACKEIVDWEA